MFEQAQAQQNYKARGHSGLAGATQTAPPTPSTLMRAMSRSDELNSRLQDLSKAVHEIATAIGGPWPCDAVNGKPSQDGGPAMSLLNDRIDSAHSKVFDIEQAVQAIRRTLGA